MQIPPRTGLKQWNWKKLVADRLSAVLGEEETWIIYSKVARLKAQVKR
jgi:hypothetical protein